MLNPISHTFVAESASALSPAKAGNRVKLAPTAVRFEQPADTVTIRRDLLDTIKKRVLDGYYNSHEVIDDLSGSFAKAFDMRT